MNTAATVDTLLAQWKEQGLTKVEIVWKLAEACLGWPYVFGAVGELCTKATRQKYYNNYINSKPAEAEQIKKRCQILGSGKPSCDECAFYPGGSTRCYDCRGFTRWVLGKVGITLQGAGCTSQWNNQANWVQKGRIEDLPSGVLACFFHANGNVMEHTGFIQSGVTLHCSGTVKKENASRKITHYAIPKGLDGVVPDVKPTLRRGDKGEYVTLLQTKLIQLGYALPKYGADGSFGAETENAVKAFQRDSGLASDGVCGKNTWAALEQGTVTRYKVVVEHLSQSVADEIVSKYGGTMTKEV